MNNKKIFEGYKDGIDKEIRDFFDLYSVRRIRFKNSRTIAVFSGPIENQIKVDPIIDDIKVRLDRIGDNMLSDGDIMSEFDVSDYIYDHFEKQLNSFGYSVDYEEEEIMF
jgi:hypothetical protein